VDLGEKLLMEVNPRKKIHSLVYIYVGPKSVRVLMDLPAAVASTPTHRTLAMNGIALGYLELHERTKRSIIRLREPTVTTTSIQTGG